MHQPPGPDSQGSETSSSLLNRVNARDAVAWERLVDLYTPAVYCWCRKAGLSSADAADIGQEVFKSVARSIARFRHDRPSDSFRGWLRTITRNKIRDFYRNRPVQASGGSAAQDALLQIPFDSDSETDESLNPAEDAAEPQADLPAGRRFHQIRVRRKDLEGIPGVGRERTIGIRGLG